MSQCGHVSHGWSDDGLVVGYRLGVAWEACQEQGGLALAPTAAQEAMDAPPGPLGRAEAQGGSEGVPRGAHADYDYAVLEIIKVVDGDTLDARVSKMVDIGFHIEVEAVTAHRFRLLGVDTPERGQPGYHEATEFVRQWTGAWRGSGLRVRTRKGDSFGRWIADVYDPDTHESLSAALIEAGLAKVWTK